jgi:gamma-glutamyltranspeptidase/glutathione hydrolase
MTESIECYFGSGVTVPGTGFLLNDQMHDFDPEPEGINSVEPGKRPASSMAPVIVLKDGKPFIALGGAGGPRIISATIVVLTNVIDFGLDVEQAVAAPRFHAQNLEVNVDPVVPKTTRDSLSKMGHKVIVKDVDVKEWWYFGGVQAVMFDSETCCMSGVADPRRDGGAVGY